MSITAPDPFLDSWIVALRAEGKTLAEIVKTLNESGHTTRQGKPWNQMQVSRVINRLRAMLTQARYP